MAPSAPSPCSTPPASAFLPTTAAGMKERGWGAVDDCDTAPTSTHRMSEHASASENSKPQFGWFTAGW